MMKFNSWRDLHPSYDEDNNRNKYPTAGRIPTVDEVDEVLSFMYADTVLQILRGQGVYRGHDGPRYYDNEIPEIKTPSHVDLSENRKLNTEYYRLRSVFQSYPKELKTVVRRLAYIKRISIEEAMELWLKYQ